MSNIEKRILWQLLARERDHAGNEPAFNHALTGSARAAEAARHKRLVNEARGWFPCPIVASPASRSRAVAALAAAGLVETDGERRGRLMRLTHAGRVAAEAAS